MYIRILSRLVVLLAALSAFPAVADATIRFLNPEGLFKPSTFSQIAVTEGDSANVLSFLLRVASFFLRVPSCQQSLFSRESRLLRSR